MGPHAHDRTDLASGIQKSTAVCEYRRDVQAVGKLAGEACARIKRGDAQHDGSDEAKGKLAARNRLKGAEVAARNWPPAEPRGSLPPFAAYWQTQTHKDIHQK